MTFPSAEPIVYLITEGLATNENFAGRKLEILEKIRRAVSLKVSLIQIREKNLSAALLFDLAAAAAEITRKSNTKLLINDRADIALAAGADGVHLTENSLPAEIVRKKIPENLLIGASVHTLEKAEQVQREGADFAVFSPIFVSPGKGAPQGLDALSTVCKKLKPFPVIALGGIDETNYRSVLAAGAGGFAAIRFLNEPENLRKILTNKI